MTVKFDRFVAALTALCREHGAQITVGGYDPIEVWDLKEGDELHPAAMSERWQDYDCPDSGIDFDLHDEQMVFEGDSFYSGCGSHHIATPELVTQYERDGDESRTVPLQRR